MNAAATLARMHAAGVHVTLDGDRLRLRGPRQPPADLLAQLRQERAEVIKLLRDDADERAAIEAEPELPTPGTAERDAFDAGCQEMLSGLLLGWQRHATTRSPVCVGHIGDAPGPVSGKFRGRAHPFTNGATP